MDIPNFLHSQFFVKPTYPTQDCAGKTFIVTGANTGLGREAARHFTRLNAQKVILAVRTVSKGEAAKRDIEASTKRSGVVEVWPLDLSSYESVKAFARRVEGLERVDAVVENAGVSTDKFVLTEDNESTITTNVVSTFLLALLLLPKLRESAQKFGIEPHLTVVTSELHANAKFVEKKGENIFQTLNSKETANMPDRYNVSKLLEVLAVRQLAAQLSASSKPTVILSVVNPGFCHSELTREFKGVKGVVVAIGKAAIARTTEEGSRTLVQAALSGKESHGQYLSDCNVVPPSKFVRSAEGEEVEQKVWRELSQKLDGIQPGVLRNI